MYLVLFRRNADCDYESCFTDSLLTVANVFKKFEDVKAYKLDGLTEILEVDIKIKERKND